MHKTEIKSSKKIFVFMLFNLFLFSGCQTEKNANQTPQKTTTSNTENEKTNNSSDSVEDLLNLVRLPELPDEVVWCEYAKANPKKLIAVLKYAPETTPKLLSLIEKNKQEESVDVGVEDWFPEELTAQAQLSGEGVLKGTSFGANDFFNIPYGSGRITRINGTDYFVLELTATN
jgi:hypothetical protein